MVTTEGKTQQEKILKAATDLLASGGAEALRVRDIAAAADCSTMGVYSHFGGKDGVVEAIFVDGFRRFTQALRASWNEATDQRMYRVGRAYRTWALANPAAYSVMFAAAVPGCAPSAESLLIAAESFEVLTDGVEAAQTDGHLGGGDPIGIAWTLWGVVHGMVMLEINGMTPPVSHHSAQDAFEAALATVLTGLR